VLPVRSSAEACARTTDPYKVPEWHKAPLQQVTDALWRSVRSIKRDLFLHTGDHRRAPTTGHSWLSG
jgi:hypothetical protein